MGYDRARTIALAPQRQWADLNIMPRWTRILSNNYIVINATEVVARAALMQQLCRHLESPFRVIGNVSSIYSHLTQMLKGADNIASATPLHRTHLPGTRAAATRSQIPLSTSHGAFPNGNQRPPGSAALQGRGSSNKIRQSLGSGNGFGLSAGIKIGRPPGTSMSNIEPKVGAYGSKSSLTSSTTPFEF